MNGTAVVVNGTQWQHLVEPNPTGISNLYQKGPNYPKYR